MRILNEALAAAAGFDVIESKEKGEGGWCRYRRKRERAAGVDIAAPTLLLSYVGVQWVRREVRLPPRLGAGRRAAVGLQPLRGRAARARAGRRHAAAAPDVERLSGPPFASFSPLFLHRLCSDRDFINITRLLSFLAEWIYSQCIRDMN